MRRPDRSGALLRGADRLRRAFLVALGPVARLVVAHRERRVAVGGTVGVLTVLVVTCLAPLSVLAIGPLVFGVPHLVSDARYLLVRPRLYASWRAILSFGGLLVGLVSGLGVRASLLAAAVAALASPIRWRWRLLAAGAALALFACAELDPFLADVFFFQAHNLVALAIWLAWRRRHSHLHLLVVGAFLAGSLWLWLGALPATAMAPTAPHWTGLSFAELGETLSLTRTPGRVERWVLFFSFAQSVHYLVWLRLLPDEDRRTETPRSFTQTARALRADLGAHASRLAIGLFVALGLLALVRLRLARDAYLGVAYAHGHIEIVAAVLLLLRPSPARS